jgi:hypothetical protein
MASSCMCLAFTLSRSYFAFCSACSSAARRSFSFCTVSVTLDGEVLPHANVYPQRLLCFGSCMLLGYVSRGVQRLVCRSLMLMFRSARPVCLLSLADCDPGYVQSPPRRAGCGGTLWEISRVWYLRLVESHFWDDVPQKRGKHAERDCARMLEQSRFPVPGAGHVLGLESFCPHSNLNR